MQVRDTGFSYGVVTRGLHWVMAIAIFGLFALGYWMVGLDYYSPYYTSAPDLHKSFGIVTGVLLAARFAWVLANTRPASDELTRFERVAARVVHWSFYPLILAVVVSGYVISTGDGRSIDMFGIFSLPPVIGDKSLIEPAGVAHRWASYALIALAVLHSAAALKHHIIDGSPVLRRMLRSS